MSESVPDPRLVPSLERLAACVTGARQVAPRADELAWAALALDFAGGARFRGLAEEAAALLAERQEEDGRVPVIAGASAALWPTAPAAFAWKVVGGFEKPLALAVDSLLNTSGEPTTPLPGGHDSTIPGWCWIEGAHSWVEPTAMAMIALRACGKAGHQRVRDGVRLLLNRQLPHGGWNLGNTVVFGNELLPVPDSTGLALAALAGLVSRAEVETSLSMTATDLDQVKTPLSLGWILFSRSAWGFPVIDARERLLECLRLESLLGVYDLAQVGFLLTAFSTNGDLLAGLGIEAVAAAARGAA